MCFTLLSFNGYNVQNFAILAEKIFGFYFSFFKKALKKFLGFWVHYSIRNPNNRTKLLFSAVIDLPPGPSCLPKTQKLGKYLKFFEVKKTKNFFEF